MGLQERRQKRQDAPLILPASESAEIFVAGAIQPPCQFGLGGGGE
jgi:hypothetical protein